MHPEAYAYVKAQAQTLDLAGARVLEIGALNVNGTVRGLFRRAAAYVGIDVRGGYGVDIVCDARAYDGQHAYDLVLSTEALEHDPEPAALIACAARALRPGGLLLLTAAGEGRPPHGCDGAPLLLAHEHYANITRAQLEGLLTGWADVTIIEASLPHDIYARAVWPGTMED